MTTVPEWQNKRELQLPLWASIKEDDPYVLSGKLGIVIEIDGNVFFPYWLQLIEAPMDALTQYHVEVARQCAKMDIQKCFEGTEYQSSVSNKTNEIRISNTPAWALRNFPIGAGIEAATAGKRFVKTAGDVQVPTARMLFKQIRGSLPVL